MLEDALVEARPHGVLEDVYREHGSRLWKAVLAFTGDPEVASDAVAEAFAQALRRGSAIRSPLAWIWRSAFRIAAGALKERTPLAPVPATGRYEAAEPAGELLAALALLSPKQRAAVVLHHYAGYSARDVAAVLGSTEPAVRVHLSRGRKRLRELLETSDG